MNETKREVVQEVSVQEQPDKDKNSEVLVLILTAQSLISKAIGIIKNNINE